MCRTWDFAHPLSFLIVRRKAVDNISKVSPEAPAWRVEIVSNGMVVAPSLIALHV